MIREFFLTLVQSAALQTPCDGLHGKIENISEAKEPCGKCGHPLASHTRDVREDARRKAGIGILSADPALLPPKPYDWRSDKPAGESGCTECPCLAWEPVGR